MDIVLFFAGVGIPILTIGFFFVLFSKVFSLLETRKSFWFGISIPLYIFFIIYASQSIVPPNLKSGLSTFVEYGHSVDNIWVLFLILFSILLVALLPYVCLLIYSNFKYRYRLMIFSLLLIVSFGMAAYIPDDTLRIVFGSYLIIFIFAGIEEIAKYSMTVYASRNNEKSRYALGIYVALGFALIETIIYAGLSWSHGNSITSIALLLLLRSIISVSIHTISTQIALGIFSAAEGGVMLPLVGAILFHSSINAFLQQEVVMSLYVIAPVLLLFGSCVCFRLARKYRFIGQ